MAVSTHRAFGSQFAESKFILDTIALQIRKPYNVSK
jgi:hypothetical protein